VTLDHKANLPLTKAFVRDLFSSHPKPGDAFPVTVIVVDDNEPRPPAVSGTVQVQGRKFVLSIPTKSVLLKHLGWRFCGVSVDPVNKELVRIYFSSGQGSTAGGGAPAAGEEAAAAADAVGLTTAGGGAPAGQEEAAAAADAVGLTTAGGGAPAGQEEAAAAADAVELTTAGGGAPAGQEEAAAAADAVELTTAGGGAPAGQEEAAAAADAVELTAVRLVLRCWVHALCVNVCKGSGCT
jgi:hypothetical protein